jgi:hypothetical protein
LKSEPNLFSDPPPAGLLCPIALTPGTFAPFGLRATYSGCPEARTIKFAAAKTRDEIEAESESERESERERGREGERERGGEGERERK